MLFNSYAFLFLFLPVTLAVFFMLGQRGSRRTALAWLVFASFVFYACWRMSYLVLLGASILANYGIGIAIAHARSAGRTGLSRAIVIAGIAANLGALAYFKYIDLLISTIDHFMPVALPYQHVLLPLAISFFTFNQIAYLADAYAGVAQEYDFLNYALFVSFFPHLVAGPIVHHKEMIPQFSSATLRYNHENMMVGLTIFIFGLFKKVVIADSIAKYADPAFHAASSGITLSFYESWLAALTFGLQLYFDFAGYSDMAIGLARMFGIRFPVNFFSPYKAASITEFWRRWHMTLSRFLREYLYIPLGGNRRGAARRHVNLMATMLLGGLWHGAAWTFVVWGGLHGLFLIVHQAWAAVLARFGLGSGKGHWTAAAGARAVTFCAVIFAWVPFRAQDLSTTLAMWRSMLPTESGGTLVSAHHFFPNVWISPFDLVLLLVVLGGVFCAPNTEEVMRRFGGSLGFPAGLEAASERRQAIAWAPSIAWGLTLGIAAAASIILLVKPNVFLYYNF
jgi:alginate O-acetyltransferase complex protein AlgI